MKLDNFCTKYTPRTNSISSKTISSILTWLFTFVQIMFCFGVKPQTNIFALEKEVHHSMNYQNLIFHVMRAPIKCGPCYFISYCIIVITFLVFLYFNRKGPWPYFKMENRIAYLLSCKVWVKFNISSVWA